MASVLRDLLNRIYPARASEPRVTMLGLGASGKTTILYLMKLNSIVTTIPSIGFNVETVSVASPRGGKPTNATIWDVGTGCGIRYLFGLLQVYVSQSDALIWVVDATERGEWLQESVVTFEKVISDADFASKTERDPQAKAQIPIMILANKCDQPNAMSIDEVRKHFAKPTQGRFVGVFQTSCTTSLGLKGSGLLEAFEWLNIALGISKSKQPTTAANPNADSSVTATPSKTAAAPSLNPRETSSLAAKLASWIMRAQEDNTPEEFLSQFDSLSLPAWDHYTHIRVAYVLLTKYGRQEGKDKIFEGLERYILSSAQTRGRTFHVTMTYFWVQIVHFGIRKTPPSLDDLGSVTPADFAKFLLINPHVADGNLWADYYSKDVIMSPMAKQEMVLPDIKPLPNLVLRDAIRSLGNTTA